MKKDMKQTVEEAARDAIHAHYKCNGEYPCGERDYCEHCNGHNTAFDCCECGADEFKEGFISGVEWQSKQSPVAIIRWFRDMYCGSLSCICVSICLWICPILIWIQDLRRIDNEVSESI